MPDLDEQLRSYFDALADEVTAGLADPREHRQSQRRRRAWTRAAAAAVVVLVLGVTFRIVACGETDDDPDVVTGSSTTTGPVRGRWRDLPTTLGDVPELSPFAAAIDEDRVLVLNLTNGGQDVAGEIIDLASGEATAIAPSHLEWRAFPAVAWTGTELIVVGGSNGPGIDTAGAAYDPATDSWRPVAPPPGFVAGRSEGAVGPGVWTGHELVSWRSGLAYDPATDSWREIAEAPLAPRTDEIVVAVPLGVLVWGGCDSTRGICDDDRTAPFTDGAFYDPAADTWTMLPAGPLGGGFRGVAAWTGDEVVIVVSDPADDGRPSVAAFDPATKGWRTLPAPPEGAPTGASTLVWTGSDLVLWGGYLGSDLTTWTGAGFVLDPRTGTWRALEPSGDPRRGHTALWTSHGLFVAGGDPVARPALFTPADR